MTRRSYRCSTRRTKLARMNHWGHTAMEHWQTHLPERYAAAPGRRKGDKPAPGGLDVQGVSTVPTRRGVERVERLAAGAEIGPSATAAAHRFGS
jgi:hypothetical protein